MRTAIPVAPAVAPRVHAAAITVGKHGQAPQGKKLKDTPFSCVDHMTRMDEASPELKHRYSLSWPSFNKLLGLLEDGGESEATSSKGRLV